MWRNLFGTLKFIFNHPATRDHKWSAFMRFTGWQIQSRIFRKPVIYPFVEKSKLIVQGGMTGATGNIYTGLHEFEEMMFLLHFLRPGDLFVDAGANIGSFTILASAVAGAGSISFEPVPETFRHLKNNVAVNGIESLVELHNAGVGMEKGKLSFTSGLDTMNHVVSAKGDSGNGIIEVDIITLDEVLGNRIPRLVKIDTEGFEMAVLQGGKSVFPTSTMMGIIAELNGACQRYGVMEKDIHEWIIGQGFTAVLYDPFKRSLSTKSSYNPHGNTIYIKNETEVASRLLTARKIRLLHQDI